jgi:hypothetical protein
MNTDWKGIGGAAATAFSVVIMHWSAIMGGVAATATALYMILHALREWDIFRCDNERRAQKFVNDAIVENERQIEKGKK